MYKLLQFLFIFSTFLFYRSADAQILPQDTVPAKITYQVENNTVKFDSELRPLRGVAGAPEPFYAYFWEFGDGNFSFAKTPTHTYADTGTYHPRLYATNNYDDGKAPPVRPGSVKVKTKTAIASTAPSSVFKAGESLTMKSNTMPKPGEEMVLILGYKHPELSGLLSQSGSLVLFYNDEQFEKNNFKMAEARTHHGEQKSDLQKLLILSARSSSLNWYARSGPSPSHYFAVNPQAAELIRAKQALFRNTEAFHYDHLEKGKENFIFFSMQTTPEMIKDTNAVVTISAMMIPDDPLAEISQYDLELQIVASHDPNRMQLKNRVMNYRFTGKNRELTYKVKFQNTGKGPAKMVNIGVNIPPVFDLSSLKIIDSQPKVVLCDSAYAGQSCLDTLVNRDSLNFIFRNIYLPGTQQEGVNDADSTKGFIEYQVRFKKKPSKKPFISQAAIIFDKNEPIYTNKSRGGFKPGLSPGIIAAYGYSGPLSNQDELGNKNLSLGFSISPYSPYRKYLQAEIFINSYTTSNQLLKSETLLKPQDTVLNGRDGYFITSRDFYRQGKVTEIDLVPLQLRYNINSFVGVGLGAITSFRLTDNSKLAEKIGLQQRQGNQMASLSIDKLSEAVKKNFGDFHTSIFGDIQLGMVRKGPALGIRYIQALGLKDQRFFTYLSWKI